MARTPKVQPVFVTTVAVNAEPDTKTASLHFQKRGGGVLGLIVTEAELQKLYWHIVHEVQQGRARFDLVRETP